MVPLFSRVCYAMVHVNHFGGARHGNTARVIGEGGILFVGAEWRENTYVHCT